MGIISEKNLAKNAQVFRFQKNMRALLVLNLYKIRAIEMREKEPQSLKAGSFLSQRKPHIFLPPHFFFLQNHNDTSKYFFYIY